MILSTLLHDVGKPYSTKFSTEKSNISGLNHNYTGIKAVHSFLSKSNYLYYADSIEYLVEMHSYPINPYPLNNYSETPDNLKIILGLLRIADKSGRYKINHFIIPTDVQDYFETNKCNMNFYS